jgi:hypothetical protein
MKRLRFPLLFSVLSTATLSALVACGGISDPNKTGEVATNLATISGTLTTSANGVPVPANAHVALVWRVGSKGGMAVGNDVAVINGAFTMNLTPPPDNYFVNIDSDEEASFVSGGISSPPSVGSGSANDGTVGVPTSTGSNSSADASADPPTSVGIDAGPGPSGGSSGSSGGMLPSQANLHPQTEVSGTTIAAPLSAAVAGFIVYVDGNGNGQLDVVGDAASSPDTILGGNRDLMLAFLQGGGALDYEKLRDHSGILPAAGYNMVWNNQGRWLPLNEVELKLADASAKLPSSICPDSSSTLDTAGPNTSGGGTTVTPTSGKSGNTGSSSGPSFPSPSDPKLHCSSDGYSWTYDGGWDNSCAPPPVVVKGLCTSDVSVDEPCSGMSGESASPEYPLPSNWPCTVDNSADASVSVPPSQSKDSGI